MRVASAALPERSIVPWGESGYSVIAWQGEPNKQGGEVRSLGFNARVKSYDRFGLYRSGDEQLVNDPGIICYAVVPRHPRKKDYGYRTGIRLEGELPVRLSSQ